MKVLRQYLQPLQTTETAVDFVLHVLKNFYANVCSEVLSKVVACQQGIC